MNVRQHVYNSGSERTASDTSVGNVKGNRYSVN